MVFTFYDMFNGGHEQGYIEKSWKYIANIKGMKSGFNNSIGNLNYYSGYIKSY